MTETGAQNMKRRHLRIYRKRRKKKPVILILVSLIFLGIAAAERIGYIEREQLFSDKQKDIPYQKVSVTAEDNAEKYYYQQLPAEQRQVYQEILEGVRNHTEEIYVHDTDADETNQIFQQLMKDQPDIFWCDGTATATTHKGTESYTVLKPKYFYTAEESQTMQTEITQAAEKWLADLDSNTDDYQKILYVYEKIVDEVEYDENAPDNQNIYSVFVNQKSVCAGYSKATQYLLEQLGVFCTYVTGKTTEGGSHAWNLVKCNGDYYYVDTTWGDPVFQQEEGGDTSQNADQNSGQVAEASENKINISYDYMCCDDKQLFQTHILDTDTQMPECSKMDYNYYVVNEMYYMQYDAEKALDAMNQTIWAKEGSTTFKFSDTAAYQQAHDDIFQKELVKAAQNLADYYGLSQVKYQYTDDPRLHKIVIFWQYS